MECFLAYSFVGKKIPLPQLSPSLFPVPLSFLWFNLPPWRGNFNGLLWFRLFPWWQSVPIRSVRLLTRPLRCFSERRLRMPVTNRCAPAATREPAAICLLMQSSVAGRASKWDSCQERTLTLIARPDEEAHYWRFTSMSSSFSLSLFHPCLLFLRRWCREGGGEKYKKPMGQ